MERDWVRAVGSTGSLISSWRSAGARRVSMVKDAVDLIRRKRRGNGSSIQERLAADCVLLVCWSRLLRVARGRKKAGNISTWRCMRGPPAHAQKLRTPTPSHIASRRRRHCYTRNDKPPPTTMNNVNNNFTTQFNHLLRERDQFKTESAAAERERRREEQILQGHRSAQHEVADHLRVAQSKDGEGSRKLQTLKESKVRLAQQIEVDRMEIVKVTNEVKGKEADDKKQKWKFVREMESINDELDALLTKEENEKTLKLLDADTVHWLVETKIAPLTNRSEGVDEDYIEAENEKWREIKKNVEEAAGALAEARERADAEEREKRELEGMLNRLREKFLAEHGVSVVCSLPYFLFTSL